SGRVEWTGAKPQLQRVYGPTTVATDGTLGSFFYFGAPYPAGTRFYDNLDGFLRKGTAATTSLSFSGATTDNRINYRLATAVDKHKINAKTSRVMINLGLLLTPFSWGSLKTNLGTDAYTNQNLVLRNPESSTGFSTNGVLDQADVVTRNLDAQTVLNINSQPL